ncbi:hypothetical protein ACODT3_00850 [Streptomyces sp. 4.24]|uniref:hypothetical protein n=1 Tax=Streptomyces tritrimontium TaxID=3406573 RepID=UPI003BB72B0A
MSTPVSAPGSRSKVAQNATVAAAGTGLALDLTVLDTPAALAAHLADATGTVVVRPEFSAEIGSALFHRPGAPLTESARAHLWQRAGDSVVAHALVPGTPYFANGVVHEGRLVLTDCWRCFTLDEGPRTLLTSVVNPSPDDPLLSRLTDGLAPVVKAAGITDGPVHFELVVGEDTLKVVKWAARPAGSPLPELCALLGVPGQAGALATGRPVALADAGDIGCVADYSFIVRAHGTLAEVTGLDELLGRPSYAGPERIPEPGDPVTPSVNENPVLTLWLRHHDRATLLADIDHYQSRNREGVFLLAR